MKKYYKLLCGLFGAVLLLSPLHSQSVNLNTFEEVQLVKLQECAVVQVNASWNYANRVGVEKLAELCFVGEIDLNNKTIGAVIQREWDIKIVPTIIIFKNGTEVMRYEPGISMRFDEREVFDKIKKEIKKYLETKNNLYILYIKIERRELWQYF